ncbi:unnamed protein product [Kuraishia capsulata CBS 1993]|uniref:glycerol kinase n=1 Tax=Kuraishia capsulata CBS 1993 TaxID=1382522 RepID=W6MPK4_9ASCO|nr:uncharacterized protein KUCA_T00003034001 [Kuraishia capsulata CBS 1993]CDK27057.1 unnamed protein product [Kuraishia capsulata CBS 1993]
MSPAHFTAFENLVVSVDVGTTSTRAIFFRKDGSHVASHQIEYSTSAREASKRNSPEIFTPEGVAISLSDSVEIESRINEPTLVFPNPGWVECDPIQVLGNVIQCLAACLVQLATTEHDVQFKISAIGIANMRETTIVWSKRSGRPLHNGIVWNDTRTSKLVADIYQNESTERIDRVRELGGCPISTYFSATKWRWLYENVPHIRKAYDQGDGDLMFGTVDTWLIYCLTEESSFVTDVTNASRTSLMNIETHRYDDELLSFWNIDRSKLQLPDIRPSSYVYGHYHTPDLRALGTTQFHLSIDARAVLQMLHGVPIAGCLGDQSASLVGQLAVKQGDAKCTYGTGAFLLYNTGPRILASQHGALTTVGYWFPQLKSENEDGDEDCNKPQYALEGSIAVAGSVVQWLRDNLRLISNSKDVGPLASQVSNSGGVVFVPAFSGLYAPYWDSGSRGTILGLTQYTSAAHIARAALEAVCYQVRAILKAMISDTGSSPEFLDDRNLSAADNPLSSLRVDGGMSKSNEMMQIQADILGPCVTVIRSANHECTALGAAIAAGLCSEGEDSEPFMWNSLKEAVRMVSGGGDLSAEEPSDNTFHAELSDAKRRRMWKLWERGVERSRGWEINDDDYDRDEEMED